jgi:hypothetical protein
MYDALFLELQTSGILEKHFLCEGNLKGFRQISEIKAKIDLETAAREYESLKNINI